MPALYAHLGNALAFDFDPENSQRARAISERFDDERGVRDAGLALSALLALPECSGGAGVVGQGLGGRIALLLPAGDARLACAVASYPRDVKDLHQATRRIACPSVIHLAISGDAAADGTLLQALSGNSQVTVQACTAGPGFDNANLPGYDRSAHWLAKTRTLALLRAQLGPVYDLARL